MEFSLRVPTIALYEVGRSMTKNSVTLVTLPDLTTRSTEPRVIVAFPESPNIGLENSGFFEVRGRRSELSSRSLPPDDHRSSKTGFRARPRFTFGLRLCDDKSAFVLPVCDFYLIHTDIKSAKCYRLI
ncbi:hypothetical protein F2Q69_00036881 [Brassica cretica]|uniref:Uncharacterized protein n=1 Tax=Brassica cretica TaxID=69181 RepID=A0A8S9SU59_BRACR|nr:hypothetical protein F2Q69_00036881 [Brassica cretica]